MYAVRLNQETGEEFQSYRNDNGMFVLCDPLFKNQAGNSEKLIFVRDLATARTLMEAHGFKLFMRGRGANGDLQQNPISLADVAFKDGTGDYHND